MTQNEITKEYTNKVFQNNNAICARCVDYEKDESKIERYKEPIQRTAKLGHMIMPKLISDWS